MAKMMKSCRDVALRLQTYLDGELDDIRVEQIRLHLDACIDCGYEADAFRKLKEDLSGLGTSVDQDALDRLKQFSAQIADQASNHSADS